MCQVPGMACPSPQSPNAKSLNPYAPPFKPPTALSEIEPNLPPKLVYLPCEAFQQPQQIPALPVMTRRFCHHPVFAYYPRPVWSSYVKVECYNAYSQPLQGNFTPYVMNGVHEDFRRETGVKPEEIVNARANDYGFVEYYENRNFVQGKRRSKGARKSHTKKWFPKNVEKKDGGAHIVVQSSPIDHEARLRGKTSLMIKNIPNQFERHDLLRILDQHCREENLQAELRSDPCRSEYDFVYLPMDFGFRANLGYAFVNFTNAVAAVRFSRAFNQHEWIAQIPGPGTKKKICEITCAFIQGKEALKNHFDRSKFPCHTNGYLPVVLSPPRDGSNRTKPTLVGKRIDVGACPPVNRRSFMLMMAKKKVSIN